MKKIVTIVGARPQFIKAAALNRVFRRDYSNAIIEHIVHTGQHYDDAMSEVFFREMDIAPPHAHFSVGSGSHGVQTGKMMIELEQYLLAEVPDAVLVYGDTNTTMAGALVAAKCNIPVIHVEAGLRSYLRTMPEEINRIVTDHLSTLLFSPTLQGVENLESEGMKVQLGPYHAAHPGVFQCGDVMYDNALHYGRLDHLHPSVQKWKDQSFVLTTIHRDHNTDDPKVLYTLLETLIHLTRQHQLQWVLPVHPRLKKNMEANADIQNLLRDAEHVHLIEPLGYVAMLQLEQMATMIVTDSGGVQKEAYFAQKPCLILRDTTEWKEIIATGNAFLVGANAEKIKEKFKFCMQNKMNHWPLLYGDGSAAEQIAKVIFEFLA